MCKKPEIEITYVPGGIAPAANFSVDPNENPEDARREAIRKARRRNEKRRVKRRKMEKKTGAT